MTDVRPVDTEQFGDGLLAHSAGCEAPDICGVGHRKLGVSVPFSRLISASEPAGGVSSLSGHVGHVVSLCPDEKMIGVDAGGIVASVKDVSIGGDGSVGQDPRYAMCFFLGATPGTTDAEQSVPVRIPTGAPLPAVGASFDLGPEPVLDSFHIGSVA